MPTFHGNDGSAEIGSAVIAEVTAFNGSNSADLAEDSACGDEFKTFKPGKKDGSGKIDCWWDPDDATGQVLLEPGAEVALVLYPAGNSTGKGSLTGTVHVETSDVNMTQDGIVQASFTYRGYTAQGLVT